MRRSGTARRCQWDRTLRRRTPLDKVGALIRLATIEAPVVGEFGKVFSTAPEVAIGEDGKTYYIKGRNGPVAFSEVAGCRLASIAGLKVPHAEIGVFNRDLY